ncbi:MAG: hypothetical protein M1826_003509 [Phylliscum demangeonii]|nr:MAG: hypothetical protein M1826_003509 [Phylliscum demangeonii]
MAQNKQGKMANLINYRMRVTLTDGRQMTGAMLAFDRHMNLVLADTEEFRRVKRKATKGGAAAQSAPGSSAGAGAAALVETEEKRTLGLTIVRGTHIISLSVEAPPAADPSARLGATVPGVPGAGPPTLGPGPGISRPAGRGLPIGLMTGPAAGIGGLAPPSAGFPPGFAGRGGPGLPPGFPPMGFPGAPPMGGPPQGFIPPPGFQPPPGGRGFPPPGFNR